MEAAVVIYGKDTCPYTSAAREEYAKRNVPFTYLNVKNDPKALAQMLEVSKGSREVPVIIEKGKVTIGFGGT